MVNSIKNIQKAYDEWAEIYDSNNNPTRDLNIKALREASLELSEKNILEIGCGTGLNTGYLAQQAQQVKGIDFSEKMLAKARTRVNQENVQFITADITQEWSFLESSVDIIVGNLVLEHIENLEPIFNRAQQALSTGGQFYIAELHPYKQLQQSQAKFKRKETGEEVLVRAFSHTIAEYITEGIRAEFNLVEINEWHYENEEIARLLTLLFKKK